ncbi:hypothetical protein CERSUDRAFT_101541 [Gelatoporia subvermispora B]|uniref:Uncharacterized protein n=1 Tax=Ceriporiopsis subvermispora (strain B) TaxID=914234 RepID=M2QUY4_CERS8|nr:hypothetical protein CERSUDRAFT_101541 [Gelatoporia subvermispora B]
MQYIDTYSWLCILRVATTRGRGVPGYGSRSIDPLAADRSAASTLQVLRSRSDLFPSLKNRCRAHLSAWP